MVRKPLQKIPQHICLHKREASCASPERQKDVLNRIHRPKEDTYLDKTSEKPSLCQWQQKTSIAFAYVNKN